MSAKATIVGAALVATMTNPVWADWQCPADAALPGQATIAAANPAHGKALAADNGCFDCHGAAGKGDGPAAAKLEVRPVDLTAAASRDASDACLYWKLTTGKRPMPGFDALPVGDRLDLVAFIRTLQH